MQFRHIITLCLSAASLVISLIAVGLCLFLPPRLPGHHLSHYDFSTPEAALRSNYQIEANDDMLAQQEIGGLTYEKDYPGRLATYRIEREEEFGGQKILFVKFTINGTPHQEVKFMEKDAGSGMWMTAVGYTQPMRDANPKLLAQITAWEGW